MTRIATLTISICVALSGCVTANLDEMTFDAPVAGMGNGNIVILGRRHAPDYDTEPDFIDCIGGRIREGDQAITVIPEQQFIDSMYPWFEPRTAPLSIESVSQLMTLPSVANKLDELNLNYMIWIDGRTQETNSTGSMTCGIGPTGAGCFGFGTWGTESEYEATIWNFADGAEVGKMNAVTSGQSYMPAVGVPIPIIAPVQSTACNSLSNQLLQYLSAGS
jgi:hypothetical protein